MIQEKKSTSRKLEKAPATQSVTLRVRTAHLAALDKIAERLGVIRSATIQLAIGEFIEKKGK